MSMLRDISHLEYIVYYCKRLEDMRNRFGDSIERLDADLDYKDAVIINIAQIGENIVGLSDAFKREHNIVPWVDIKDFGNVVISGYDSISIELLYTAITVEMPKLKKYCEEQLKKSVNQ